MKLMAYFTRAILVLQTLVALLLLWIAFIFNDTREPAIKLLAIWGGYPFIGLVLIFVNEFLLRIAYRDRMFRRKFSLIWASIAVVAGCALAISAYF